MSLIGGPPGAAGWPGLGGEPAGGPPVEMLPGDALHDLLIGRSERAEVTLAWVGAYPTGLEIRLTVRIFDADPNRDLAEELLAPPDALDETWPGGRLVWGFEFADGSTVTSADAPVPWPLEVPPEPVAESVRPDRFAGSARLVELDGVGSRAAADLDYWLPRLPPPGAVRVVCRWLAEGIGPTRREVDAEMFRDAARRARRV